MRVGLTGGIGSGKSTVAAMLADLGAVIIDADLVAREVVGRGSAGLAAVVEAFGPEVLTPEGDLDRPRMGELVFADSERRRRLEEIVHPLVYERTVEQERSAPPGAVVVHDIPLLAESGRADTFAAVVVVDTPPEVQLRRLTEQRGMTERDARSRIEAQASREQRLAIATHVVENSGSREDLRRRVREVYDNLAAEAER